LFRGEKESFNGFGQRLRIAEVEEGAQLGHANTFLDRLKSLGFRLA
jgi:hypothetical protein